MAPTVVRRDRDRAFSWSAYCRVCAPDPGTGPAYQGSSMSHAGALGIALRHLNRHHRGYLWGVNATNVVFDEWQRIIRDAVNHR